MKRFVAAALLLAMLALAVASGWRVVRTQPADGTDGGLTQATATATLSPASGLREQIDELVLTEGDVSAGFHTLLNTDMDLRDNYLGLPVPEGTTAHLSMLLAPDSQKTIMSIVVCCQDDAAMEKAFSDKVDLDIEEVDEAFNMVSEDQRLGQTRLDTRELDVSALGERAYGLGFTTEMADGRVLDQEIVAFGRESVVGVIMTGALDGAAPDAVPLAQTMADKIQAASR